MIQIEKKKAKKNSHFVCIRWNTWPCMRKLERSEPESFPNRFIVGSATDRGHMLGWPDHQTPPPPFTSHLPTSRVSLAPDVVKNSPAHWFLSTEKKRNTHTHMHARTQTHTWLCHIGYCILVSGLARFLYAVQDQLNWSWTKWGVGVLSGPRKQTARCVLTHMCEFKRHCPICRIL